MELAAALCGRAEECDYPEAIASLPAVGGMLMPDVEAIAELQPDFVLMQSEPAEELARLFEERGVKVLVIPAASDWDTLAEMYEAVGKAFAGAETGPEKADAFFASAVEAPMKRIAQMLGDNAGTLKALYAADGPAVQTQRHPRRKRGRSAPPERRHIFPPTSRYPPALPGRRSPLPVQPYRR